jgi:hypothetical protein
MEKTAVQQVFSELENLHPHLFNIYSTEGREFVNHFHKFLEIEKQQILKSFIEGRDNSIDYFSPNNDTLEEENYYKETFSN